MSCLVDRWDQREHFGCRMFHRLTPAHFDRTSHSRMNLGIAIVICVVICVGHVIFRPEHARELRMLHARHAPWA